MRRLFQYFRASAIISLLCILLIWSFAAQAATPVNTNLEEQVLQIIRKHPEVIVESLQAYQLQEQQQLQKTRQKFLQELKTNTKGVIGESPTIGSTTLSTVLIEFSDFQCPYCAEAETTLKPLLEKHPNLTLVYKNFPLSEIHPEALSAAAAAWAAKQQGKFWEYHDALFANQKQLGEALYLDLAKKFNLDLAKFKRDRLLANSALQKDLQLAESLGLSGTPSFVLNSKNFSGAVELSEIERILSNQN